MPINFEKHAAKGNEILKEIEDELLVVPEDKAKAGRVMKAVLHALRNRLPVSESMQLLAQLPMALKGIYVDGWRLSETPKKIKHVQDFLDEVANEGGRAATNDFPDYKTTFKSVISVFSVLKKHVTEGEISDLKAVLPVELKVLLEDPELVEENLSTND